MVSLRIPDPRIWGAKLIAADAWQRCLKLDLRNTGQHQRLHSGATVTTGWRVAKILLNDVYANTRETDFTINFFMKTAKGAQTAALACPFFTHYEAVKLLTDHGCEVQLLVRLCDATDPRALRQAQADARVKVKYFTSRLFHAKFYIVDDVALVGSANLTGAGLRDNRELSILMRREEDEAFSELPGLFDELFEEADQLDQAVIRAFEETLKRHPKSSADEDFEKDLTSQIPPAHPRSTIVGSGKKSKVRSFLQRFKTRYEKLGSALAELEERFKADDRRRPEFLGGDLDIEISRFLGWVRIAHAPGDSWADQPLRDRAGRGQQIEALMDLWFATDDVTKGDMIYAERELANIEQIRTNFASSHSIEALTYDEIFDTLSRCHAFYELLRFTKGSIAGLRVKFAELNPASNIKRNLIYLLHGRNPIDPLARAYDCLNDKAYKLRGFGESCTMELLGWIDVDRHPINGRTIRALRYLGFEVS